MLYRIGRVTLRWRARLAATLAQLGRLDDASSPVKAGDAINSSLAASCAHAASTAMSDEPTYPPQLQPIFDGILKAGVPKE